jgi:hypothetical protein
MAVHAEGGERETCGDHGEAKKRRARRRSCVRTSRKRYGRRRRCRQEILSTLRGPKGKPHTGRSRGSYTGPPLGTTCLCASAQVLRIPPDEMPRAIAGTNPAARRARAAATSFLRSAVNAKQNC